MEFESIIFIYCLLPVVQERRLCLEGHQILKGPENQIENIVMQM